MTHRILIADDDYGLRVLLQTILEEHGFDVIAVPSGEALVRAAVTQHPDLLLIDVNMPVMDGLEAIRQLRNDTRTSHLPMLLLTARTQSDEVVIGFESGADDYISKPFDTEALIARIKANLRRQARVPSLNPLTELPGNNAIADEVQQRLATEEKFGLLYFDFDNFKALNDAYGPARGDRVIKLLATILREMQQEDASLFIGHIGGDDFVAITAPDLMETLSQRILQRFDTEVLDYYDPVDRSRGFLRGVDRFGMPRRFPIVSVSVGGVSTEDRSFASYDELAGFATEMKSYAKKFAGSSIAINGRVHDAPMPPSIERRGQPLTIVLISQHAALREAIQPLLGDGRCRLVEWSDTPPIGNILDAHPDLVVLHVGDPRNWSMSVALRESSPALPLVLASPNAEDEHRAWACGAYAFLAEPYPPDYFRACIAQLLRLNERLPPDGVPV